MHVDTKKKKRRNEEAKREDENYKENWKNNLMKENICKI